jgi:hypothetical protein
MTTTDPCEPSEREKLQIQILLKEYDTLRQEIVGRINSRFSLVGFGSGLAVFLASQKPTEWDWLLIVSWLLALVILWWRTAILLRRCSIRIAYLEQQINSLAGAELLAWESHHGGGWLRRIRS